MQPSLNSRVSCSGGSIPTCAGDLDQPALVTTDEAQVVERVVAGVVDDDESLGRVECLEEALHTVVGRDLVLAAGDHHARLGRDRQVGEGRARSCPVVDPARDHRTWR